MSEPGTRPCERCASCSLLIHHGHEIVCPSGRVICITCYKLEWRAAHGNDGVFVSTGPIPELN